MNGPISLIFAIVHPIALLYFLSRYKKTGNRWREITVTKGGAWQTVHPSSMSLSLIYNRIFLHHEYREITIRIPYICSIIKNTTTLWGCINHPSLVDKMYQLTTKPLVVVWKLTELQWIDDFTLENYHLYTLEFSFYHLYTLKLSLVSYEKTKLPFWCHHT